MSTSEKSFGIGAVWRSLTGTIVKSTKVIETNATALENLSQVGRLKSAQLLVEASVEFTEVDQEALTKVAQAKELLKALEDM